MPLRVIGVLGPPWIAFFADGKFKKFAVQGGSPVTLCCAPESQRMPSSSGANWGDDGNIIAAVNFGTTGLVRILSGGGAPTPVTVSPNLYQSM